MAFILFILGQSVSFADGDSTSIWDNSDAPGSLNDPMKAMTLYSPSFNIPKLNRFDGIVRGAPQASAGYFVDGTPLLTFSEASGLQSLSEQAIYPENYGASVNSTTQIFPVSSFFFDGYRSWFSGQGNMSIALDASYAPVEYGFFCGPLINLDQTQQSNCPYHFEANGNNFDATLKGLVSTGDKLTLAGSARLGYNRHMVERWIKPYSWSGDVDADFPVFVNYGVGSIWQPSERFVLKAHADGAVERRSYSYSTGTSQGSLESIHEYTVTNVSVKAGFRISEVATSITNVGFAYGNGRSGLSGYFGRSAGMGALSLREKIRLFSDSRLSPCFGIDFRSYFGQTEETFPFGDNSSAGTSISNRHAELAPFVGLVTRPVDFVMLDAGVRMDKYQQLTDKSSSCFAISPWRALQDSSSVDLSYRLHAEIGIVNDFGIGLSSGLYNQPPGIMELRYSEKLRSLKSSRHSLSQFGAFPCHISYKAEAYFQQFWDFPVFATAADISAGTDPVISRGMLKSKGGEFSLSYSPISLFSLLLGYGLRWNDQFNWVTNDWTRSNADRRHKLSGIIDFTFPFGLNFGTGIVYSSGAPYTPIFGVIESENYNQFSPIYSSYNSSTGDSFTNLSLRISYSHKFGQLSAGIYAEGWNILSSEPDHGTTMYSSNEDIPQSIDSRAIAFGLEVKY